MNSQLDLAKAIGTPPQVSIDPMVGEQVSKLVQMAGELHSVTVFAQAEALWLKTEKPFAECVKEVLDHLTEYRGLVAEWNKAQATTAGDKNE